MDANKTAFWSQKHTVILDSILWPNEVLTSCPQELIRRRKREINVRGFGLKGTVQSTKLGRSVPFESMNECNFLNLLEKMDSVAWYQEQPLSIPYEWNGQTKFYYPDFCVALKDGRYFIAEVKELYEVPQFQNAEKLRSLWKYCRKNGLGLLVIEGTRTIQRLCEQEVDPELKKALLERLVSEGRIESDSFKYIQERFPDAREQLPAIVLEERLIWKEKPFVLMMPHSPSAPINT